MQKMQTFANKKGEIEFRKKLVAQIQTNSTCISGQPTQEEYISILKQRVDDTRSIFKKLQEKGIPLSPFLEIGAERGQRSMLLVNEFNAVGFMTDISYESLQSAEPLKKTFGFKKMPAPICCDAYNLPFKTGSIPFIFCFQTLHHFPDPKPIVSEIKRVLSPGGYFYCNEEPIQQILNLALFRRDFHLRWYEKVLKATGLLHFISLLGKSEVEYGILEEAFSLETWEKALNVFPQVDVNLIVFPFGPHIQRRKNGKKNWITPPFASQFLLRLLGGGIEAICQKEDGNKQKEGTLLNLLACPNCSHKPKLSVLDAHLFCKVCKSSFKKRNSVFMLFSKKQKKILYSQ